jgi:hypothetical protein
VLTFHFKLDKVMLHVMKVQCTNTSFVHRTAAQRNCTIQLQDRSGRSVSAESVVQVGDSQHFQKQRKAVNFVWMRQSKKRSAHQWSR